MPPEALENLHRIGQLKREPFDPQEFERLLVMAQARLADAQVPSMSTAHQKRNLAEYEGYMDVSDSTIAELCALVPQLLAATRLLASS